MDSSHHAWQEQDGKSGILLIEVVITCVVVTSFQVSQFLKQLILIVLLIIIRWHASWYRVFILCFCQVMCNDGYVSKNSDANIPNNNSAKPV